MLHNNAKVKCHVYRWLRAHPQSLMACRLTSWQSPWDSGYRLVTCVRGLARLLDKRPPADLLPVFFPIVLQVIQSNPLFNEGGG